MREAIELSPYTSFRSRDFRLFLAGSLLSNLGLQMLSVAVSWDLYLATRSAVVLGNVGFVQVAPFLLFALWAGHFADQRDRRSIMLVTQAVVIAASGLLIASAQSVTLIYSALFLTAAARAFQGPARLAILPHVVREGSLSNAITWTSSVQEIANVTGPAIAGLILAALGSRAVYIIQLICATFAGVAFYFLSVRSKVKPETTERRSLLDGIQFVRHDALILPAISLDLFAVLFGGASALLPAFTHDVLHAGPEVFGYLRAAPGLGAVVMAVFLAFHPIRRHVGPTMFGGVAVFGIAILIFGLTTRFWVAMIALVILGASDMISIFIRALLVQLQTPDEIRGRVSAVNSVGIGASNELGEFESGVTAAWLGLVPAIVLGGALTLLVAIVWARGFFPALWRLQEFESLKDSPA